MCVEEEEELGQRCQTGVEEKGREEEGGRRRRCWGAWCMRMSYTYRPRRMHVAGGGCGSVAVDASCLALAVWVAAVLYLYGAHLTWTCCPDGRRKRKWCVCVC